MKNRVQAHAAQFAAFSAVFFSGSLFLTLDIYCKNQVTPETPLLNIAGLPFLRMDFVLVVFATAFAVGMIAAGILKKFARGLRVLVLGGLGCIAVFLSLFDVDTLQLLAPTMRISHVIMTVSRVLAITAGAGGIFAGVYFSRLSDFGALKKPMCIGAAAAVVCSVFANAENLQTVLYAACGVLLLLGGLLSDFAEPAPNVHTAPQPSETVRGSLADFLGTSALTVLFGISYSVWCENAGFSETGLTVIAGCICIVLVASARTRPNLQRAAALLLGSAVSYCLVHFASEVITYSANRVVYVLPYWVFALCFAVYLGSLLLRLSARKNKPQNGNG